ncbi:MAG: Translocation and assembly module subunit TamA [Desulfovibrio sp.]
MSHLSLRFCIISLCFLLASCGGATGGLLRLDPGPDQTGPSPLVAQDPAGPIPAPNIPEELRQKASPGPYAPDAEAASQTDSTPTETSGTENTAVRPHARLRYSVVAVSEKVPQLADAFLASSLLEMMRDDPPSTITGLDQRMRTDLDLANDVLHAFGYYAGEAHGRIQREQHGEPDENDDKRPESNTYTVTVTFEPGEQYTVGKTRVTVTEPYRLRSEEADEKRRRLPASTLADVGVKEGDPAIAGAILDAVSSVRENFRDRGYPYAKVASSRYVVDHSAKTLDVDVLVDSGPLVYMGDLEIQGGSSVTMHYLESLVTWRPGRVWNQSSVDRFRDALRQSGLFSAAEINPAETEGENGWHNVVTELTAAPERTVGGALKYDTDFGPGVQGYWEHRNITGRGDRLRVEAPIWADLQELAATYRLPFFLRSDQDLIAGAGLRSEDTDAYELKSARASIGLERRLSRRWRGSLSVMGEGGTLKDPDEPERDYFMVGLPGSLRYDGANNLLDATRGFRFFIDLAPYTGEYNEDFTVLRTRLESQAFLPVVGDDTLVMAFRAMYGFLNGEDAPNLPASIRFYTGGGGSVRGYEYQSLGPRNSSHDPLGGSSTVELSAEARLKFNDTIGMVAFLDGGMAYTDQTPDFGEEDLRWGAGLGLRLYTAIGPVRLDVAFPLNKRDDDDNFQIYFSIGQSF